MTTTTKENKLSFREMKKAIKADFWNWSSQTGPDDLRGYDSDQRMVSDIESARSWDRLAVVAPIEWSDAVCNRCHRLELGYDDNQTTYGS